MKAWKLEDIGKITYTERPVPVIGGDEVLVKIKAAGICGSDIPRVYETGAHVMPLIVGHEFSGIVESVGRNVDDQMIGKRVGIFPLIPCGKCPACLALKYEMCSDYSYLGSRKDGGFCEYTAVPVWNLIGLPDGVTYEQAAMLEPMAVAVHAMRRYAVNKDMTIAICGMGTIGFLLLMFLKEMGARNVYALGNKDIQRTAAAEYGAGSEDFCDMREGSVHVQEWITAKTAGRGVDVYFECAGRDETIGLGTQVTATAGRICLVGNPASDILLRKDYYGAILRKQLTVTGSWNSSFRGSKDDDWHYVLERLKNGAVKPEKIITHMFAMNELNRGLELMKNKTEEYIKVMAAEE